MDVFAGLEPPSADLRTGGFPRALRKLKLSYAGSSPTLDDVHRALGLNDFDTEAAQRLMAPRPRPFNRSPEQEGEAKLGGVLLLLYPAEEGDDELSFVLTRRAETLASHRGQISLPGGAREPGETLVETALREAREELDIRPEKVVILGQLTPIYILPSDFEVHPALGYAQTRPRFTANPDEVAAVLEMPLRMLLDDATKVEERWTVREVEMDVPFYRLDGQAIWGATAMILSEFEQRLKRVTAG